MKRSTDGPRMAYRAFSLNEQGRLGGVPRIIEAASDIEAARQAEHYVGGHGLELWEGARLVARVHPQPAVFHDHRL